MKNFDGSRVTRRSALKATGGVLGGLALGAGTASSVAAQSTVYRYDELEALLVDVDADPPAFRRVRTSLFLPEPLLEDCNTDHPCSIDVLDYESAIDDDDDDDDDDGDDDNNGDDDGDDDDDACPDYGAVTLLCHGASLSDAVALTGLVPDVLTQNAEDGFDFVVELTPSDETNVTDPESVSNPCPAYDDDDDDDDDDAGGEDDGSDDDQDDDDRDDDSSNGDDDADNGSDDDNDDGDDDNDD